MTATEQANRLFMEASLADETLGYPDRVAFVASDNAHRDDIVWRNLGEDVPTVIVDEDALEIMLVPVARSGPLAWLDRARGRVLVRVSWRQHDGAHTYEVPAVSLNRSRLAGLEPRRPALA
ncbi:MAG: hypothetical protein WD993_00695 [Thermoleophilaceae bacterium]